MLLMDIDDRACGTDGTHPSEPLQILYVYKNVKYCIIQYAVQTG